MAEYVAPELNSVAFNCPYCDAYAKMSWYRVDITNQYETVGDELRAAKCSCCYQFSLWIGRQMIIPSNSTAPMPHKDMPENVKTDYLEAREILNKSPRGACALLRLAIDKLCDELSEDCKNKKLNIKIQILVDKGLSIHLQKIFDFVRLTGNDAVHELGEINAKDNPEIALMLFKLINMIIEKMITEPNAVNALYDLIPEPKKEAIEERNLKTKV